MSLLNVWEALRLFDGTKVQAVVLPRPNFCHDFQHLPNLGYKKTVFAKSNSDKARHNDFSLLLSC